MSLKGLEQVVRNLNREIKAIEGRSLKGLIRAAIIVRRSTEETPPLVPIDKGFLRNSWFTNPGYAANGNPFLTMGYDKGYAVFVHEMIDSKVKWSRPGSGPKWFQAAFRRNKDAILAVIKEEAQIK